MGTTCAPVNGFPAGVPDGVQVGFINAVGVPIKQVLSATLQANSPYTLRVDIGRRSDGFAMVHYAVRLVANGVTLAEDPGLLTPPLGGFATSTVTFTAPTGHPQLGKPLEIQLLLLQGPQANFDNVRLEGPTGTTPITGDLTNDGAVSGADLGVFLGSWGPCAACGSCPADFNGDCVVNATDLAILLGAWTG
ncbi:MAG: hypothetical protein SGJ11_00065 [Phycisphaerae bacterium]|nr:hypothetical protein [Phycisphaerae bacterium]